MNNYLNIFFTKPKIISTGVYLKKLKIKFFINKKLKTILNILFGNYFRLLRDSLMTMDIIKSIETIFQILN